MYIETRCPCIFSIYVLCTILSSMDIVLYTTLKFKAICNMLNLSKVRTFNKRGFKNNIAPVRPITNNYIACELFEIYEYHRLYVYMSIYRNSFLKSTHSTTTNFVDNTPFIGESINRGSQTDIIYWHFWQNKSQQLTHHLWFFSLVDSLKSDLRLHFVCRIQRG